MTEPIANNRRWLLRGSAFSILSRFLSGSSSGLMLNPSPSKARTGAEVVLVFTIVSAALNTLNALLAKRGGWGPRGTARSAYRQARPDSCVIKSIRSRPLEYCYSPLSL